MNLLFICKLGFHKWHSNYKDSPFGSLETQHCKRCEKINVVTPDVVQQSLDTILWRVSEERKNDAIEIIALWIRFCIDSKSKSIC